jgi:MFS family permease
MGVAMMLWAVVSALTAVSKNFTGLLLTRFFLGVTEAPYYPGAVYLLSIFYTRKEVATRIAILYTGNILATAFAGLIAAGIFHGLDDVAGIVRHLSYTAEALLTDIDWMALALYPSRCRHLRCCGDWILLSS